ncbi:MAG: VOC family protein [Sedimentibacter sp.]|uniref:VOC family protein n=1 Tax=Sedimentibacter sp. TaxID=1960295 RepID=UPI0031584A3F
MLVPHLHLNGKCQEAISVYENAFNTKCDSVEYMCEAEPEKGIQHAEIHIHGQRVMLNDRGGNEALTANSTVHLVVVFSDETDLKHTYKYLCDGCVIISPIQAVSYSPCTVSFIDKFGVRWSLMV